MEGILVTTSRHGSKAAINVAKRICNCMLGKYINREKRNLFDIIRKAIKIGASRVIILRGDGERISICKIDYKTKGFLWKAKDIYIKQR